VLATHIPNARLVPLASENHILLADEPAWQVFLGEVAAFLESDPHAATSSKDGVAALSPREREVLILAADGLANDVIAERLVLSRRTVERHLSNAYVKLGLEGATARAGAVAALLRSTP
jgi:DNA-binding NarL/FixJ family response regulator